MLRNLIRDHKEYWISFSTIVLINAILDDFKSKELPVVLESIAGFIIYVLMYIIFSLIIQLVIWVFTRRFERLTFIKICVTMSVIGLIMQLISLLR